MATEFDEKLKAHPLYALATEVGSYRLRMTLKSQKAFDIELANMMKTLEKQKEKLTVEQTATYEQALEEIKQGKSEPKTKEEPTSKTNVPEAPSTESTTSATDQKEDVFYQIFELLYEKGMLKKEMIEKFKGYKKDDSNFGKNVNADFRAMLRSNSDEENKKIIKLLKDNDELIRKFKKALKREQAKEANPVVALKAPKQNSSKSTEKKGENKMADTDFLAKLKGEKLYELAASLPEPKIALDFTVTDEASYKDALAKIKDIIKKRQNENTEEQNKKDLDALEGKDDLKEEYKKIEQENKPRGSLNVEDKEKEPEEKTPDLSWIEQKQAFWKAYAEEKALTADFNAPEGETAPLYCKLSNGDKEEGVISYSSPNDIQITKESSLILYQGLVKDAVQNNLSITFGKTLDNRQKLMLYAAVLLSEDTYNDTKEKVQAVNPPALTDELMNPEVFDKLELPEEAKKALRTEYNRQVVQKKLETVHAKLKQDNTENNLSADERYALRKEQADLMRSQLSPEKLAARKAKGRVK